MATKHSLAAASVRCPPPSSRSMNQMMARQAKRGNDFSGRADQAPSYEIILEQHPVHTALRCDSSSVGMAAPFNSPFTSVLFFGFAFTGAASTEVQWRLLASASPESGQGHVAIDLRRTTPHGISSRDREGPGLICERETMGLFTRK